MIVRVKPGTRPFYGGKIRSDNEEVDVPDSFRSSPADWMQPVRKKRKTRSEGDEIPVLQDAEEQGG